MAPYSIKLHAETPPNTDITYTTPNITLQHPQLNKPYRNIHQRITPYVVVQHHIVIYTVQHLPPQNTLHQSTAPFNTFAKLVPFSSWDDAFINMLWRVQYFVSLTKTSTMLIVVPVRWYYKCDCHHGNMHITHTKHFNPNPKLQSLHSKYRHNFRHSFWESVWLISNLFLYIFYLTSPW